MPQASQPHYGHLTAARGAHRHKAGTRQHATMTKWFARLFPSKRTTPGPRPRPH